MKLQIKYHSNDASFLGDQVMLWASSIKKLENPPFPFLVIVSVCRYLWQEFKRSAIVVREEPIDMPIKEYEALILREVFTDAQSTIKNPYHRRIARQIANRCDQLLQGATSPPDNTKDIA
ncbi:MAG: hypothetical protein AAF587_29490 [Bacteroidota bacterium]